MGFEWRREKRWRGIRESISYQWWQPVFAAGCFWVGEAYERHRDHVHCVVPAGGLAPDHSRWIDSQQKFFLPVGVLKKSVSYQVREWPENTAWENSLSFHGTFAALQNPKAFAAWLRPLFRPKWVASLPRRVHPSYGNL
jgi:hypothetical protein